MARLDGFGGAAIDGVPEAAPPQHPVDGRPRHVTRRILGVVAVLLLACALSQVGVVFAVVSSVEPAGVRVAVRDEASAAQVDALVSDLNADHRVKKVVFLSAEAQIARIKSAVGDSPEVSAKLDKLSPETFPPVIEVNTRGIGSSKSLKADLEPGGLYEGDAVELTVLKGPMELFELVLFDSK